MALFSKKTLVLVLSLAALLTSIDSYATTKAQAKPVAAQKLSTLDGKFSFSLPKGYVANAMPAGKEESNTAGATGTMYVSQTDRRVIIAAENKLSEGLPTGNNDDAFLDSAVTGFVNQQTKALGNFKQTGENRFTSKGLGVREIDSTATMGGGATLNTTFLAGSGNRVSVVQVISRADDQAGHAALIKRIVDKLRAP
ncbi:hypothetical protein [Pseudomonas sp. NA-150]|uniref:hypothetical protein n=1 Tax=Pseudomonas sp. NA-150 TaxID=3367525 RepID=UPI0037CB7A14